MAELLDIRDFQRDDAGRGEPRCNSEWTYGRAGTNVRGRAVCTLRLGHAGDCKNSALEWLRALGRAAPA
jgi:hypothetical protein